MIRAYRLMPLVLIASMPLLGAEAPKMVARLGSGAFRHSEGTVAAVSPRGELAALTTPSLVDVWDLSSGRKLFRLSAANGIVARKQRGTEAAPLIVAIFSPDGRLLHTLDGSGGIRTWEARTGKAAKSPFDTKGIAKVNHVVPSVNGKTWLLQVKGCFLHSMDPVKGTTSYQGMDYDDILAVSGGGRSWVSHSPTDALYEEFYVGGAGSFQDTLPNGICAASLSLDGRYGAAGGEKIKLWDLVNKKEIALERSKWPGRFVRHLKLTPNGKELLATGYEENHIARWSVPKGNRLPDLEGNIGGIQGMALSADGRMIVTTGRDHVIRRFDLKTGKQLACRNGLVGRVAVALSSDGRLAAGADRAGSVRLWSAPFRDSPRALQAKGRSIDDLAFAAGKLIAIDQDGQAAIWDLESGKRSQVLKAPKEIQNRKWYARAYVSVSPNGKLVVATLRGQGAWGWNVATGELLWRFKAKIEPQYYPCHRAIFVRDGREVLIGAAKATVVRLDAGSGKELERKVLQGVEPWPVCQLCLSPRGKHLVACTHSNQGRIVMMDQAGKQKWNVKLGLKEAVGGIRFAPGGRSLVTSHWDGSLRVWNVSTGAMTRKDKLSAREIVELRLSTNGLAIVDSGDARVAIWKLPLE